MKKNIAHYLSYTKNDLPAGLVVFLVALPLCLGIALASGAPLFSGIITGVIAGLVVSLLSGSQLSVSGPAAGLTVIVLNAITELGSFETFLLALCIAGILQLLMGFLKAGAIGLYFPTPVIKGMLAAIGLILISTQISHFFGVDADAFVDELNIENAKGFTVGSFGYIINHIHPGALLVGAISLAILILWELPFIKKRKLFKLMPGALIAVIIGVILNHLFYLFYPTFHIQSSHLVQLPILTESGASQFAFNFPDLNQFANIKVYTTAATIAIIASLETLLSVEAGDKLDPMRRITPQNRELKAQGVGNFIAGLIGGIPMTAVIVRTSANIASDGKTKMAAFYHGVFLVGTVLLIPTILNMIPLATLAAVLLLVGYKLTKPAIYKKCYKAGKKQFIPFIVTIVAILCTDLLVGILIGMSISVFYILRYDYREVYEFHFEPGNIEGEERIRIKLKEHLSFLNKANLQKGLNSIPEASIVIIDGSDTKLIDNDALEVIHNFCFDAKEKGIITILKDIPELKK